MSKPDYRRAVAALGLRHFRDPDTTEAEREAVLLFMVEDVGGADGELAARILQHRREEAKLQLELGLSLNPPSKQS